MHGNKSNFMTLKTTLTFGLEATISKLVQVILILCSTIGRGRWNFSNHFFSIFSRILTLNNVFTKLSLGEALRAMSFRLGFSTVPVGPI